MAAINLVKEFLSDKEWQFSYLSEKNLIIFGINGKNGVFQCIIDIDEQNNNFTFLSICGLNVPKDKQDLMLYLLNTLNYRLFIGNFQMNPEDGEVRFKTSLSYRHFTLNKMTIEDITLTNILTMDTCLPAITHLVISNNSVEEALALLPLSA